LKAVGRLFCWSLAGQNFDEVLDGSRLVCPGLQTPAGSGAAGCGNRLGTEYASEASRGANTPTSLYSPHIPRKYTWPPPFLVIRVADLYYGRRQQRDFQTDFDQAAYLQYFGSHDVSAAYRWTDRKLRISNGYQT
jgi:hypothetical protein